MAINKSLAIILFGRDDFIETVIFQIYGGEAQLYIVKINFFNLVNLVSSDCHNQMQEFVVIGCLFVNHNPANFGAAIDYSMRSGRAYASNFVAANFFVHRWDIWCKGFAQFRQSVNTSKVIECAHCK